MLRKLNVLRGARQIVEFVGVTLGHVCRLFRMSCISITREGGFLVAWRSKLRESCDGGGSDA
jgi:hypothetical protein